MRSRMASTACRERRLCRCSSPWACCRRDSQGQSTVEFALVTAALLCVVVGLGAFWHVAGQGVIVDHAVAAASHHVAGSVSATADVFAY